MIKPIEWIQGLRAVAVLAVIIYHLNHALLPGGFLGVDLFFVISGFLITRKLMREIEETGTINVLTFWGGRAKRLLPNALLVLTATLVATFLLLAPYRFSSVSTEVTQAALFLSNYLFASHATDYFHSNDQPSPVLHFWSLSIEEQYYIGLPLILFVLSRLFPKRRCDLVYVILFVAFISSLIFCLFESQSNSTAAFFHTQSRIWQLALGGIVGINFDRINTFPQTTRASFAYLGGITFVASAIFYNNDMGYPGWWAIVPTSASAFLLIGISGATRVAEILSLKAITTVGDRSYSLYLWHWPVLSLAAERWPESPAVQLLAVPVFVALAYVSYAWIEKPAHYSQVLSTLRIPLAAVGISAVSAMASLLASLPVAPTAVQRAEAIKKASSDFSQVYADHCHLNFDKTRSPNCIYGALKGEHTVVLFGDSHAAQWFNAIDSAATKAGWRLISRTKSSCPSIDVGMWLAPTKTYYEACDEWRRNVLAELAMLRPDLVIIANSSHYNDLLYDRLAKSRISAGRAPEIWQSATLTMIEKIIAIGISVVILRDNPQMLASYKLCLSYSDACGRPRDRALTGMTLPQGVLTRAGAKQLDINDSICSASWCPATINGSIIYQDDHHLTASFAKTLWPDFLHVLKDHSEPPNRPTPRSVDVQR